MGSDQADGRLQALLSGTWTAVLVVIYERSLIDAWLIASSFHECPIEAWEVPWSRVLMVAFGLITFVLTRLLDLGLFFAFHTFLDGVAMWLRRE